MSPTNRIHFDDLALETKVLRGAREAFRFRVHKTPVKVETCCLTICDKRIFIRFACQANYQRPFE